VLWLACRPPFVAPDVEDSPAPAGAIGPLTYDVAGGYDVATSVAVAPDGDILVAGTTLPGQSAGSGPWLLRLGPDGSLERLETWALPVTTTAFVAAGAGSGAWVAATAETGGVWSGAALYRVPVAAEALTIPLDWSPRGLWPAGDGVVVVGSTADGQDPVARAFDASGSPGWSWSEDSAPMLVLEGPVVSGGVTYAATSMGTRELLAFDGAGSVSARVPLDGRYDPASLAVLPDGDLVMLSRSTGRAGIDRVGTDGIGRWSISFGGDWAAGLDVDAQGRTHAVGLHFDGDALAGWLRTVDGDGVIVADVPLEVWQLGDVAVDATGGRWVVGQADGEGGADVWIQRVPAE
jgi:hypothetical protein